MSVNGLLISNADFKEFRFFPENLIFPLLPPALCTLISSAFFLTWDDYTDILQMEKPVLILRIQNTKTAFIGKVTWT